MKSGRVNRHFTRSYYLRLETPFPNTKYDMTSRDSEARRSMGPPVSSKVGIEANSMKQRGPNPQTDYKRHFNRTKERFDVVNTVSNS
jgi:hypothetical protein